jgi:hypothetical protein
MIVPNFLYAEIEMHFSKSATDIDTPDYIEYGDKSAPYKIDMYFAPTCAHCADFFRDDFEYIQRDYIKKNKARIVMHLIPLTVIKKKEPRFWVDSVIARIAASKGHFFNNILLFLKNQSDWFPDDPKNVKDWKEKIRDFSKKHFDPHVVDRIVDHDSDDKYENALTSNAERTLNSEGVLISPVFYITHNDCEKKLKDPLTKGNISDYIK